MLTRGAPLSPTHPTRAGRAGRPHRRLLWLDVSDPGRPTLVWHDGDAQAPGRVKSKDRLPLVDILDIRAGRQGDVLKRSGRDEDAGKYMTFASEGRTLDIEAPSGEGRDWLFKKFADLFQAYATAQQEGLSGDEITTRVMTLMDVEPAARAEEARQRAAAAAAAAAGTSRKAKRGGAALPFAGSARV